MSARYYTVWQCQGCSSAGTREEISILDVCPKCGVYDWKKRTATLIPAVCAPANGGDGLAKNYSQRVGS